MAFGLPARNAETTPLLQALGLSQRDLSPAGLAALQRLVAERDELAEKLAAAEALADRDTLTPTHNRRAFLRELHRTMSEVERYKTPAAVLYVDLDGFKAMNDSYGHAAGDEGEEDKEGEHNPCHPQPVPPLSRRGRSLGAALRANCLIGAHRRAALVTRHPACPLEFRLL